MGSSDFVNLVLKFGVAAGYQTHQFVRQLGHEVQHLLNLDFAGVGVGDGGLQCLNGSHAVLAGSAADGITTGRVCIVQLIVKFIYIASLAVVALVGSRSHQLLNEWVVCSSTVALIYQLEVVEQRPVFGTL